MTDETVILNGNSANFVEDEADAAEADIYPGNVLEYDGSLNVVKSSSELELNTQGVGRGMVAILSRSDPDLSKADAYPNGERVHFAHVPIGGKVDARLAAGGDLSATGDANITQGDLLQEADVGALEAYQGITTVGDGTGATAETVHDHGALYIALESVDNSGAAAGVGNQVPIEVVRIA